MIICIYIYVYTYLNLWNYIPIPRKGPSIHHRKPIPRWLSGIWHGKGSPGVKNVASADLSAHKNWASLELWNLVGIQYLLMGKMMLNIDSPSGFWGTYPFVQTNLEKKTHTHMILLWAFKRTVNKIIHRLFAGERELAFWVIVTYCNQYVITISQLLITG